MTDARRNTIILSGTDPDLPQPVPLGYAKYHDFHEIGRGGKAILHSAIDVLLGRRIAIKSLLPQFREVPHERRRFLREARVTAQLAHPNTVPVYEIVEDDRDNLYFAMKRIDGEDLYSVIKRLIAKDEETVAAFPVDRLLNIVIQASQALAYAHAHGVIHRDVKPENIWVGRFGEVILLDWGVAKVWGTNADFDIEPTEDGRPDDEDFSEDTLRTLTRSGQRPGTPLYMSPEQVAGHKYVTEHTDIFSLGVLLYELLTLQLPFYGRQVRQTFDQIVNDEPQLMRDKAPDRPVPDSLQKIVSKALQKDPADRHADVFAFIRDVNAALADLR